MDPAVVVWLIQSAQTAGDIVATNLTRDLGTMVAVLAIAFGFYHMQQRQRALEADLDLYGTVLNGQQAQIERLKKRVLADQIASFERASAAGQDNAAPNIQVSQAEIPLPLPAQVSISRSDSAPSASASARRPKNQSVKSSAPPDREEAGVALLDDAKREPAPMMNVQLVSEK